MNAQDAVLCGAKIHNGHNTLQESVTWQKASTIFVRVVARGVAKPTKTPEAEPGPHY
jgi:hypothetical protein